MNCPRFLLISLLLCLKSYDYILICFQLILFHCIQYIYKLRIVFFIPNFLELCRKKWLNVLLNFASFVVQCAQTIMLHCLKTNVCVCCIKHWNLCGLICFRENWCVVISFFMCLSRSCLLLHMYFAFHLRICFEFDIIYKKEGVALWCLVFLLTFIIPKKNVAYEVDRHEF